MWQQGLRKSNKGCTRFSLEVRAAVCDSYYTSFYRIEGVRFEDYVGWKRKRGREGDRVLDEAWRCFEAQHTRNGRLLLQPRSINKEAFRRLIDRHFPSWIAQRRCPSKPRKKIVNLTAAELHELAELLATPIEKGGKTMRFQSIEAAVAEAAIVPRISALVDKSGCGDCTDILQRHLLQSVPELHLGPEDRTQKLCQKTLKDRQALADVLAGRVPWIVRPSTVPVRSSRTAPITSTTQATPAMEKAASDTAERLLEFYWQPEFMDFVFMLDATHFSDKEGPIHARAPHVFYSTRDVYGPTEVERDKSITETTSIMVYCLIHKHLGLVLGPDVMYTGTRFKKCSKPKQQLFREHGIETWYATSLYRVGASMWQCIS